MQEDVTAIKTCRKCGENKPRSEFYRTKDGDGRRPRCKACCEAQKRDYRASRHTIIHDRPYLKSLRRFFSKIKVDPNITFNGSPCWLWTATLDDHGYGNMFARKGGPKRSHQFAYRTFVGPIPDGLQLDHLCRVRRCANPAHLEPVTGAVNMARGSRAQQTHCKQGHEFTPENTYYRISEGNGRACRICRRVRVGEFYKRNPDYDNKRHRRHVG